MSRNELSSLDIPSLIDKLRAGGPNATEAVEQFLQHISTMGKTALLPLLEASVQDSLTKLLDRSSVRVDVEKLLADNTQAGLFIATDIVDFGTINNQYGQTYGDRALQLTANGLRNVIRTSRSDSTGYRIGGDEFVAILRNGATLRHANRERLVRRKMIGVLGYLPLVEFLHDSNINQFGIRAGAALIDATLHQNYDDVLADADPKLRTICEYALNLGKDADIRITKIK